MADDKKIIIDEDWKSQVAAEKKAAAEHSHRATAEEPPAATQSGQSTGPADFEMPPADFGSHIIEDRLDIEVAGNASFPSDRRRLRQTVS